ncbi:MAG: patatin-like phospholipase family protein, partial [Myxococcota bacterium]
LVASAEEPPTVGAVVVSGGGALGSYMAGNLFLLDQLRSPDAPTPTVYTGASAGAILSFTALLEACRGDRPPGPHDPTESLFWKAFVPMGLDVLTPVVPTPRGVFSKAHFADDCCDPEPSAGCRTRCYRPAAREAWEAFGACDRALFGAPITRVRPVTEDLRLPRSLEHVMVELTPGRGAPDTQQIRPSTAWLPFGGPGAFDLLSDVVSASSSFPVAFPSEHLPVCAGPEDCDDPVDTEFIDGGIFDNQPLGLALDGLAHVGADDDAWIYLVLPGVYETEGTVAAPRRALAELLKVTVDQVAAARTSEFTRAYHALDASDKQRVVVSFSDLTPTSDTFSGFFDPSFRTFDFYLGMWQTARTVRKAGGGPAIEALEQRVRAARTPGWEPYLCLRHGIDDTDGTGCEAFFEREPRFCALLRAALERSAGPFTTRIDGPRVVPDKPIGGCPHRTPLVPEDGEYALDELFRILAAYDYPYETIDARGDAVQRKASYVVGRLVDRYARAHRGQPEVPALGRVGVSSLFGYHPPRHSFYAVAGPLIEGGYSFAVPHHHWDWLRFGAALELDGFRALGPRDWAFFSPQVGAEFELLQSGIAAAQVRLGLRGAWVVPFGSAEFCADTGDTPCAGPAGKAYVSLGLLGIVRLQLGFLGQRVGARTWFTTLRPSLGLQYELR